MSRPVRIGALMALALATAAFASLCYAGQSTYAPGEAWSALLASIGIGEGPPDQLYLELRIYRVIVAIGVGASLALSGALLQGVFRNPLASPDFLGVSSGASLGAALAILAFGGQAPGFVDAGWGTTLIVALFAFAGAVATVLVVAAVSGATGLSVPGLLLLGVAINAMLTALLIALQSIVLADTMTTKALLAWGFGTLTDRLPEHAILVSLALMPALLLAPFLARELDLLAGGEDDASALGVSTKSVQWLALGAAALAAAGAVAVAGQIGFVGLLVPHALRLFVGWSHRALLPLSALAGALLLLSTDCLQRSAFGVERVQPGVAMALLGGPLFLLLLVRSGRTLRSW